MCTPCLDRQFLRISSNFHDLSISWFEFSEYLPLFVGCFMIWYMICLLAFLTFSGHNTMVIVRRILFLSFKDIMMVFACWDDYFNLSFQIFQLIVLITFWYTNRLPHKILLQFYRFLNSLWQNLCRTWIQDE